MSHRSRRGDDRDRSHSSHRYEKYEQRHRRDDSRDRDYYHSKSSSSRRDKYRSRSRSASYSSKSYTRHHHNSRSRSPGHNSSRHYRSRSRSPGYSNSRYQDDYHRSHHRAKDHRDDYKDLPEKSRNSPEHSQIKYNTNEKFDKNESMGEHEEATSNNMMNRAGASSAISIQINENAHSEQPKTITYDPNDPDAVLEEEKQRIQRETLERLQKHLEAEGKSYPPKKPQASHPIFANDGSFLEMFKSMQGNMQQHHQFQQQPQLIPQSQNTSGNAQPTKPTAPTSSTTNLINRFQPKNRRRGAKILKTGIVQKQRVIEETDEATVASNDSWNAYLKEVKRYKTVTCSDDNMTRSLVK